MYVQDAFYKTKCIVFTTPCYSNADVYMQYMVVRVHVLYEIGGCSKNCLKDSMLGLAAYVARIDLIG
jgi:hypothetical protein